ncbi:glutamate-1-semialdehyde 2,1-aminomutase [Leucobacter luti]|uniref:Glutamate-1-semialdehyde 2,1-aminomutase n=1 Tax=Leucobacter luti TaxID=340320 RepID=A0A4R6RQR3_9MICO|nr:aminotransferase class III-fold pyridoxal phosphate-dependent enzyme [Leucobacter luti]TDP89042.1 glutamate-1-semialdehyde 2,1-aminomutase [Leucobacter luti]
MTHSSEPSSPAIAPPPESVLPHGVSSYARHRSHQVTFERTEGAYLFDASNNRHVDFALGLGPLLLGHRPPRVTEAVHQVIDQVDLTAGVTNIEVEFAASLVDLIPCADKILFQSSGSEAVHLALRIARATTGRKLVVKFEGHYHGWLDPIFASAPGVLPDTSQSSTARPPVPNVQGEKIRDDELVVVDWGDIDALQELFAQHGDAIAAVIMEPVPYNFGAFAPSHEYLSATRDLCTRNGSLLVFDEVVSGFRLGLGGAQHIFDVTPDIAVFGKAIGAGFPLAFVAASDASLASVSSNVVRQGGTYNAHPIGVAAGLATLEVIKADPDFYASLEHISALMQAGIERIAAKHNVPLTVNRFGSVLQTFWGLESPPQNYQEALRSDTATIQRLFEGVTAHGVYIPQRGLIYLSSVHQPTDVQVAIDAIEASLQAL